MLTDFKERGREGEKHPCERETSVSCLSYIPCLTRDKACKVSKCPDQELTLQCFCLQDDAPANWATLPKAGEDIL